MKPQNIVVTSSERRRAGQYSDVSVIAFGIAPPSPSPVTKRHAISSVTPPALADAALATPKHATQASSSRLRPNRSPNGPNASAPAISPASPAPNTGASCAGDSCHSARITGATNPIDAVSNPSIATMRKHNTTIAI
ncbi:hypothetical protein FEP76_05970 [Burkholderia multivorans]|nr:hypothetical protein [Burkholderia multivorans]